MGLLRLSRSETDKPPHCTLMKASHFLFYSRLEYGRGTEKLCDKNRLRVHSTTSIHTFDDCHFLAVYKTLCFGSTPKISMYMDMATHQEQHYDVCGGLPNRMAGTTKKQNYSSTRY